MAVSIEDAKADYLAAKQAVGKIDAKILFVRRFRLEGKQEAKNEHKILAITSCRIFIITKKAQGASKVDFSFHILELHSLDSSKPMALNVMLNIADKQYQHGFLFANQEDVEKAVSYMMALLKSNFLNADVEKQVSLKTETPAKLELINHQTDLIVQSLSADGQPCGSFALAYMCLCDYFNQLSLAEVIWDVNKIYSSHNSKNFEIEDFDHLEPKELLPLVAALGYNTWFTKLTINSYKLTSELVDAVVKAVKRSSSLEEIIITDAHLNKDHLLRLSLAFSSNPNKVLRRIDFSKNNIDDKGLSSLAGCFSTLPHGLESLSLHEIGVTTKGAGILSNALKTNKFISTTLIKLDLSGNSLKAEGAQSLCDFLAQPNALETLSLSHTESALDLIFGALLRGCQQNLQHLSLAGNPFSYRKSKESQSLPSIQQFFSSSRVLKSTDLSSTKLPPQAVKAIFIGLMNNPVLTDVSLDLSHNELKSAGCSEIVTCLKDMRCLTTLILSDNGLDQDLIQLCEALDNNSSLKHLDLSHNVSKSKYNGAISESMAEMIMSETLHLETLSIADCKLRLDAAALFDCIGTNESLISINISGNGIGDTGARLIGKALQINTKLKEIYMDRNGITHKGLQDIAVAMERNFSLHSIPLPITDLTAAIKHNAELFTKYYTQIEKALIRNQSLLESTPGQAYKVHQGLLISNVDSYTQFTDSLVVDLQDLVSKHRNSTDEKVKAQIKHAKSLIKETDSFRQVLLELFSAPESAKKMLNEKFQTASADFASVVEGVLKVNVDNMLDTARKICPNALNNEASLGMIKQELVKDGLVDKIALQNSFIKTGKSDLLYKLCESNLTTATSVAEQLKKVLIESLQQCIDEMKTIATTTEQAVSPPPEVTPAVNVTEEKEKEKEENKVEVETENKETDEENKEEDKPAEDVVEKSSDENDLKKPDEDEGDKIIDETDKTTIEVDKHEETSSKKEESDELEKEDGSVKVNETEDTKTSDSLPSSPINVTFTTDELFNSLSTTTNEKDEDFDMPWEFTAGNRLSVMVDEKHSDDDSEMEKGISQEVDVKNQEKGTSQDVDVKNQCANKARTRLSTLAQSDARKHASAARKKKASVKRRPTFYRAQDKPEEVEIDISSDISSEKLPDTTRSDRTGSSSSVKKERLSSGDEIDGAPVVIESDDVEKPKSREKLMSIGGFDAISANASQLKVNKKSVKPIQGRRAPTRVSHLAHMDKENTEKYIEDESSKTPATKQRPVSAVPSMSQSTLDTPTSPQRAMSEKVKSSSKPPAPSSKKPEKKEKSESKKEKKKPIGGIQLPSLGGFLKKRSSSKNQDSEAAKDNVDGKSPSKQTTSKSAPPKQPEPETIKEEAPPKPSEEVPKPTEEKPAPPAEKPKETPPKPVERPTPEVAKPEATKRQPMIPKIGIPMAGGSALMAEMMKRKNKGEEKPSVPTPSAKPKPTPPSAASKPEPQQRSGSISKPPPPKRPPSLKKPNPEGKPVVTDRPKPAQRPRPDETVEEKTTTDIKGEGDEKELKEDKDIKDENKNNDQNEEEEKENEETSKNDETTTSAPGEIDFI